MRDWREKTAKILRGNRGFTVAEMLVSLTVLAIALLAFVPLLVHISEGTQANRARLVATNLAGSILEQIRGLPYNKIGLVGGNPDGVIEPSATVTVDGLPYNVETRIWWVEDTSDDDAAGNDPIPYDYKRVQVTVSAPGLFTGRVTMTADIHTLSSMEGEEEAFPGGNIRAEAYRGWKPDPAADPEPVEDVRIDLTAGPDAPQTHWTDDVGKVLFAILGAGTYTVEADASGLGMMVRPDLAAQEVEVVDAITMPVVFEAEYSCHLSLQLVDAETGEPISTGGAVYLEQPYADNILEWFTADMIGWLPRELFGDLWPVGDGYSGRYDLTVWANKYLEYVLSEDEDALWDGTFSGPDEHRTVNIPLTRGTASVTVLDADSGEPVVGAAVTISVHTYTYHGGVWVGDCSDVKTKDTPPTGWVSFLLPDNDPYAPPDPAEEGDQYSRYCVEVTADGYETFGPAHGVFWVTGEQQYDETGPIDTYTVYLEPVS
ncbi:MAG TPA: type II secretion system protein [Desulfotomaculum sp.]|nr:type II secretion system protein [Desulfotomaculum sp.]